MTDDIQQRIFASRTPVVYVNCQQSGALADLSPPSKVTRRRGINYVTSTHGGNLIL